MPLEFGATQALFLRMKDREFVDSRAWRLDRLSSVVIAGCRPALARAFDRESLVPACLRTPAAAVSERVTIHSPPSGLYGERGAMWVPYYCEFFRATSRLSGVTDKSPFVRAPRNLERLRIGFLPIILSRTSSQIVFTCSVGPSRPVTNVTFIICGPLLSS